MRQSISRDTAFLGHLSLIHGPFRRDCGPKQDLFHEPTACFQPADEIVWPSVVTVISAAILIGAEVFGAAFAGGWALAILFGLDDTGAHILQAVLFGLGVLIMVGFIRAAQRIEPFFKRPDALTPRDFRNQRNRCGTGANALPNALPIPAKP